MRFSRSPFVLDGVSQEAVSYPAPPDSGWLAVDILAVAQEVVSRRSATPPSVRSAGDHTIFVGRVEAGATRDERAGPLCRYDTKRRRLPSDATA